MSPLMNTRWPNFLQVNDIVHLQTRASELAFENERNEEGKSDNDSLVQHALYI